MRGFQHFWEYVKTLCMTTILGPVRRSTLDIGRAFELHTQRYLNETLHMTLRQVGGTGDGGVDLKGWWWLPRAESSADAIARDLRLRVLGQCKAERKPLGARVLREIEGVVGQSSERRQCRS